jgi:hypothetical protein
VPQVKIGIAPRRVGPHDGDQGSHQGQRAADGLAAEQVAEEGGLTLVGLRKDPAYERHWRSSRH